MIKFFKIIDSILLILCVFLIILSMTTGGWIYFGVFHLSLLYLILFLVSKIMQIGYLVYIKNHIYFVLLLLCVIFVLVMAGLDLVFNSESFILQLFSILWGSRLSMLILLVLSFMIALFTQMFISEIRSNYSEKL